MVRCDQVTETLPKQLARQSDSRAMHARVVVRLALSLAVRHEGLAAQSDGSCRYALLSLFFGTVLIAVAINVVTNLGEG